MRAIGLVLLALTAAASSLSADETYAIRLMRPKRVGDRYRLEAKGTDRRRQRVTVGGQPAGNEEKDVSVHLIAAATVLAVDAEGNPLRIEYRIETCRKSSQGKSEEVLPAGRKVTAESRDGKTVFTSGGDPPLDDAAREALGLVISAHARDSPSDDEIFGARDRKRIGDKWGINAVAAARNLSKNGVLVSAADLDGSVQLKRVRTVGPVKALEVTAHLRVKVLKVPAPEGTTVERAGMEADLTGLFPADPRSVSPLPDKLGIRMNVLMAGRKPDTGERIEVDVSMEMTLENSYSPIPNDPKPQSRLDSFSDDRISEGCETGPVEAMAGEVTAGPA